METFEFCKFIAARSVRKTIYNVQIAANTKLIVNDSVRKAIYSKFIAACSVRKPIYNV
jgi:hypothetical protein